MPISIMMVLGLVLPLQATDFQQHFAERQRAGEQYCRHMASFVAGAAHRRGLDDLAEAAVLVAQAADDRLRAREAMADAPPLGAAMQADRAQQLAALYARAAEREALERELLACAQLL